MEKLVPAIAAVAFVLGLALGGFGFCGALAPDERGPDPESPAYSVSSSGVNCLDVRPHSGWVHEVASGRSFAVTLNATVVHERGRTVSTNVSRVSPGSYRIALRTVPGEADASSGEHRKKSPPAGCRVATGLRLGVGLPTDYREFEVTVNGRTLLTVENEDTVADLYQLPNPVNATVPASASAN